MDSFVLAETFKYLYLLFSEKSDLLIDVDDYIFTTEAHLLPLSLSIYNSSRNTMNKASIFCLKFDVREVEIIKTATRDKLMSDIYFSTFLSEWSKMKDSGWVVIWAI